MLEWEVFAENGIEIEWRNELQTMLILNVKAEMQVFEERDGGLALWLKGELGLGIELRREGFHD
jgi:meiotic recombination protein SPO11